MFVLFVTLSVVGVALFVVVGDDDSPSLWFPGSSKLRVPSSAGFTPLSSVNKRFISSRVMLLMMGMVVVVVMMMVVVLMAVLIAMVMIMMVKLLSNYQTNLPLVGTLLPTRYS